MKGKIYYSLYDRLLHKEFLYEAFRGVKSSGGTGGIDNQDIGDFAQNLDCNITLLLKELKGKTYRPKPVKRVEIEKETGGKRLLGIPTVRDRVVQHAVLNILQPIFEEDFHPSSYGYRPGRSCHQAISKAQLFIRKYDLKYVVDMDLSKCFDTLDHKIILKSLRKRITDGSVLELVESFLKSGVMTEKGIEKTLTGSPQGGVISPLLANIYLNAFDQFMKSRNYRIVRYADDILILSRSKRSAEHALEVATEFLEKKLKLTVNREKTHITHSFQGVKYLGVTICSNYTSIQKKKIKAFKEKVKKLTRRTQGRNLKMILKKLNPILRGFCNYFRIANCKNIFLKLMEWIRRRLRSIQLKLWKKPRKLHKVLRRNGRTGNFKKIKMTSWKNSCSQLAHMAMPNCWFDELKLFNMEKVDTGIIVPC
ncbi:MAG: group II intron reverse transcriptase/maturase [Desulfobacteraceae bacterium]|nr:group II intron reverse transcriptase/maturase [Desulfobacteraceae bacterium]